MNTAATGVGLRAWLLRPQVLDRVEQIGIVILWGPFAWRMLQSTNPYAMAVMLSEFAVLIFTLLRRPTTAISVNLDDWLLACTATLASRMLIPA